jgi:hypothetical protein
MLEGAVHDLKVIGSDASPSPLKLIATNQNVYELPVVKLVAMYES